MYHRIGGSIDDFVDAFPGDLVGEGVVPFVLLVDDVGCQQAQLLLRVELIKLRGLLWSNKQSRAGPPGSSPSAFSQVSPFTLYNSPINLL